jgi:hypothetical protein
VFLLFLLAPLVVFIRFVVVLGGSFRQRGVRGGFLFAHATMIFPGIEDQVQPRHHLFDRRQLAGWSGFAARTGLARRAGLALRPGFAARSRFALRPGLARRAGVAWSPGLAARTFDSGPAWMSLRTGFSRLATRASRSRLPF